MMHNSNLMYVIYPCRLEEQDILETFFQNTMWKDHKLNKGEKGTSFLVDENLRFKSAPTKNDGETLKRYMPGIR